MEVKTEMVISFRVVTLRQTQMLMQLMTIIIKIVIILMMTRMLLVNENHAEVVVVESRGEVGLVKNQ